MRERLREVLLAMNNDEEGRNALKALGAVRFIQTADQDYGAVLMLVREAGLNLAAFDYANE